MEEMEGKGKEVNANELEFAVFEQVGTEWRKCFEEDEEASEEVVCNVVRMQRDYQLRPTRHGCTCCAVLCCAHCCCPVRCDHAG